MSRADYLRRQVRLAVADILQGDLDGDEQVVKEVYEECRQPGDLEIVHSELRVILAWVKG